MKIYKVYNDEAEHLNTLINALYYYANLIDLYQDKDDEIESDIEHLEKLANRIQGILNNGTPWHEETNISYYEYYHVELTRYEYELVKKALVNYLVYNENCIDEYNLVIGYGGECYKDINECEKEIDNILKICNILSPRGVL